MIGAFFWIISMKGKRSGNIYTPFTTLGEALEGIWEHGVRIIPGSSSPIIQLRGWVTNPVPKNWWTQRTKKTPNKQTNQTPNKNVAISSHKLVKWCTSTNLKPHQLEFPADEELDILDALTHLSHTEGAKNADVHEDPGAGSFFLLAGYFFPAN